MFIQNFLDAKLPADCATHLSGAQLTALWKSDRSIRPIACGIVYRRLASRLDMWSIKNDVELQNYLEPHQISVGTAGGLEAGVHALRHTLSSMGSSEKYVLLSIDFSNAFNRCSRQAFLAECQTHTPALARYIHYTYGTASLLHTRPQSFLRKEGTQQGDPWEMLLFSLVSHPLITHLQSTLRALLNIWMSDDGTFVPPIDAALKLYEYIKTEGPKRGLYMQKSKTKSRGPQCQPTF